MLVLNDADCFALAEARQGAGRGHRTVFGVILGTGVGGGLVIDGRLVTGAGGYAGEWGHGPVMTAGDWSPVRLRLRAGGLRGHRRRRAGDGAAASASVRASAGIGRDPRAAGRPARRRRADDGGLWRDLVAGPLAMVVNVVGADRGAGRRRAVERARR